MFIVQNKKCMNKRNHNLSIDLASLSISLSKLKKVELNLHVTKNEYDKLIHEYSFCLVQVIGGDGFTQIFI